MQPLVQLSPFFRLVHGPSRGVTALPLIDQSPQGERENRSGRHEQFPPDRRSYWQQPPCHASSPQRPRDQMAPPNARERPEPKPERNGAPILNEADALTRRCWMRVLVVESTAPVLHVPAHHQLIGAVLQE